VTDDPLAAARTAFERHAWREAFEAYREAEAARTSLEPKDLDRLAQSAWWLTRIDDCLNARERAYAGYLSAADEVMAAYEALWLARDNFIRLRGSIGAGWFKRAEQLLDGKPESAAHAYLEQSRSMMASSGGDLEAAVEHARRAVEIGARFGDRDIQARALSNQGEALVAQGVAVAPGNVFVGPQQGDPIGGTRVPSSGMLRLSLALPAETLRAGAEQLASGRQLF
jgi:tetratricopeptide (TPR) repeat protein